MNVVSVNIEILLQRVVNHSWRLHSYWLAELVLDWRSVMMLAPQIGSSAESLWLTNAFYLTDAVAMVALNMGQASLMDAFPLAMQILLQPHDCNILKAIYFRWRHDFFRFFFLFCFICGLYTDIFFLFLDLCGFIVSIIYLHSVQAVYTDKC